MSIISPNGRVYGRIKDIHDDRDHKFLAKFPQSTYIDLAPSTDYTMNMPPAYDQGGLGSCHDAETEVLTENGWKFFNDLDGSEKLATVNPITKELFYELPSRIVKIFYEGNLHCFNNRCQNFKVTPDHQMLISKWDEKNRTLSNTYNLVPIKNIGWYSGLINRIIWNGEDSSDTYTLAGVPTAKLKEQRQPKKISMTTWLRFLGIYLAEGTIIKQTPKLPTRCKIQIAASKEREKKFVRQVLLDLGVNGLELSDRFTFENRRIYEAMKSLGLYGVKAGEKFVPPFIFKQSSDMIKEFLAGHFAGDGCEHNNHQSHYTGSFQLAEDLQRLIFLSGRESYIAIRGPRTSKMKDGRIIVGRLPEHRVSVCEKKGVSISRKEIFLEKYIGYVFCAEVPTFHTLITRREGSILISGNCSANAGAGLLAYWYPTIAPSRLQIYWNTRKLEGTINSDSGAQTRDMMKVLVSNGAILEDQWPYDITKFTETPPSLTGEFKMAAYSRLVSARDMFSCLALGNPFVLGFECPDYFDSNELASHGVFWLENNASIEGGHDVLAIGYDLNFKTNPDFLASGIDPSKVQDQALLIRNSWNTAWGSKSKPGHFWMPIDWATSSRTGADSWTATKH